MHLTKRRILNEVADEPRHLPPDKARRYHESWDVKILDLRVNRQRDSVSVCVKLKSRETADSIHDSSLDTT